MIAALVVDLSNSGTEWPNGLFSAACALRSLYAVQTTENREPEMPRAAQPTQTYVADCLDCKYHWVSRAGYGTPDYCPKCRSKRVAVKPT